MTELLLQLLLQLLLLLLQLQVLWAGKSYANTWGNGRRRRAATWGQERHRQRERDTEIAFGKMLHIINKCKRK